MAKKVITIEYEKGGSQNCNKCPLMEHPMCYSENEANDIDCTENRIISVTVKDE